MFLVVKTYQRTLTWMLQYKTEMFNSRMRMLLVGFIAITLMLLARWTSDAQTRSLLSGDCLALHIDVSTARNTVESYSSIYESTYKQLGYQVLYDERMCREQKALPLISTTSCSALFEEWLQVLINYKASTDRVPESIPSARMDQFLLNGLTRHSSAYYNEKLTDTKRTWSTSDIDAWIERVSNKLYSKFTYGSQTASLVNAVEAYQPLGSGLVVGSLNPWVEAIMLHYGASHLTTVEYATLNIKDPRISYLSPKDFASNWSNIDPFDFAASFSSIEHSGLGRFGDPLDPYGDLKEVQKVRCVLKTGGLFYLGLPTGSDALYFNAHRIYGAVRWPLMLAGFELIGVFSQEQTEAVNPRWSWTHTHTLVDTHMTYVLRKI